MWMEGNSSLWPNEPPRNGLVLPVGVLAAVRIPGQTLPEDCEKKRESHCSTSRTQIDQTALQCGLLTPSHTTGAALGLLCVAGK